MDDRALLEQLDASGTAPGDAAAAIAFLASREVPLEPGRVRGALRRALLLLAAGGDPRRELDPDDRAVRAVADELDAPAERASLRTALEGLRLAARGLPSVEPVLERLLADEELAWRLLAAALLASELAGDDDDETAHSNE